MNRLFVFPVLLLSACSSAEFARVVEDAGTVAADIGAAATTPGPLGDIPIGDILGGAGSGDWLAVAGGVAAIAAAVLGVRKYRARK